MKRKLVKENERVFGRVRVRHVATRGGRAVGLQEALSPRTREALRGQGIRPEMLGDNLVVNVGRATLARMLRGVTSTWINRVQLGDAKISGVVRKSDFPPDLSDVTLIHEIRNLGGQPGATFDLDSSSSPDEVIKVDASVGTPGTLTAGSVSTLTDITGVDFVAAGVTERDTVTVVIGGEDFVMGVNAVVGPTELEVANPGQLAGAVGYTVQTPGTQALFTKTISGDNFPESEFGPVTVVHEAGLLFTDGSLFNRITFQQNDDSIGLVLQPTDIDGTRIDVQLDWLITF